MSAELYAAEGVNRPYLIDMEFLTVEPDAVAQMDLVWLLFETAAAEKCGPEQRQDLRLHHVQHGHRLVGDQSTRLSGGKTGIDFHVRFILFNFLEQRQALVNTAQTITEMCGLGDLLMATLQSNVSKLAEGLKTELDDIRAELKAPSGQKRAHGGG